MTSNEPTSVDVEETIGDAEDTAGTGGAVAVDMGSATNGESVDALDEDVNDSASADDPDSDDGSDGSDAGGGVGDDSHAEDSDGDDSDDGDSDNPLDVEAEVAADYLEELLDIADLDGDIDTYLDGDRAHVSVISESTILVGRDGEVLDALQELTRLAVLAETGQRSRLMLDVAGYRAKRRTELVALAGDAVQEAKDSAEAVHLTAMNPFERKIVHDAVAAAGLTSESEGEEPRRHVVVLPNRG